MQYQIPFLIILLQFPFPIYSISHPLPLMTYTAILKNQFIHNIHTYFVEWS